ncbi:XshC-Cox1 family protein [Kribbella sp. ALI-6-A]|uniref:XdhC family protein n=1 Tax=Kribbella sp. ALI-6-A TaxID=1933817 RepID=UPI00097CB218|nr:XdhC/CoxI family protein [Kribbella sp. ALI-6-A]ONI74352.1 XshC-Cox1 family protein [Kribbella sp. ALI-6-A]
MRDVLNELLGWWEAGHSVGVATVVATSSSAPRSPGAALLVGPEGVAVGSVSGGCVEGAVYDVAQEVIASGRPTLEKYGYSDETAFSVGLTCGGLIDIFVRRVDAESFPELSGVAADVASGRPVAVAVVTADRLHDRLGRHLVVRPAGAEPPPGGTGTLGDPCLDAVVTADARGLLALGKNSTLRYGDSGQRLGEGLEIFVESFAPPPRMLVFGAIDFAAALSTAGAFLGYRVTVCDARAIFATPARFPAADEVVVDWPHRYLRAEADGGRLDSRTVLCALTHDLKFDIPLLEVALRLPEPAYVGAMGSRRTVADRLARLRAEGLTTAELSRLSAPIGLDLGARTPEETAISIAAEILAHRTGATASPLAQLTGPIHDEGPEAHSSGRNRST